MNKTSLRSLRFSGCLAAALLIQSLAFAQGALTPNARVAIIGDSITEQKLYSKYMEAYLLACSGVPGIKVVQFGWGGETASGFANRLENDLSVFKPTVATTCYGMNDGSYRPFNDEIGNNYRDNMRKVITGLKQLGVKTIVAGSPGAVDTTYFRRDNFAPLSGGEGYNLSLGKLRDIDRALASELNVQFADVHQPIVDVMAKAKAALGNDFDVCGRDGVHPGPNGHLVMAYAFLRALGCDGNIGEIEVDMTGAPSASAGHKVLAGANGKAELESTRYPFCFEGEPKSSSSTRSLLPFFPFNQDLNRLTLKVKHLTAARARVTWGDESHEFTREQLESGVNLAAEFDQTPFSAQFAKLIDAIGAKQQFETGMIKMMVTNFRQFRREAQEDPKLVSAFGEVGERLMAHQQQLDAVAREQIVPVKHTITVTPL